jgi:hypothetical protein
LESINSIDNIYTIHTQALKILDPHWNFHSAKCYNPRDRFFALYGIAVDIANISMPQKSFNIFPFIQTIKDVYLVADYNTNRVDTYLQLGSQDALL